MGQRKKATMSFEKFCQAMDSARATVEKDCPGQDRPAEVWAQIMTRLILRSLTKAA